MTTRRSPARIRQEVASFLSSPGARVLDEEGSLALTLSPPGQNSGIGPESGARRRDGIGVHRSPHGSTRYLRYVDGEIASGLQVVSADGKIATIANVYTAPGHRGGGLASALLERARRDFDVVRHASDDHTTTAGRRWRDKNS